MLRLLLVAALLLATADSAAADEPAARDEKLVSELRRLQLFDLAERHCRQRLVRQLQPEHEAKLTIELIRTLALDALSRPPSEREPRWQAARNAAREFERAHPGHPHKPLILVQDALTELAQGEIAAQEAEAAGADPESLQAAAELLRSAARSLDQLQQSLLKEIPGRRQSLRPGELSAEELDRLQVNIGLHLAKARKLQAMCYPAESRDRQAMLLATLDALEQAVARLDSADPLAAEIRVLQMECFRLLGRLDEAERIWPLVDKEEISPHIRRRGLAEGARLLIAAGNPLDAITLLDHARFAAITSPSDPELKLARLEVLLAAAKQSEGTNQASNAAKQQRAAAALAQRIDQMHGRAWGRRADQLVTALLPADAATGNVELLARMADNLFLKGQIEEALAAYDKAAVAARSGKDRQREFEVRYKAALVEQERSNAASASARFERLAVELKEHSQAAEAHLQAIWNKAQQLRGDEAAAASYVALLGDHLARFPDSPTSDQVRLWLGAWWEARGEWSAAMDAYCEVRPESTLAQSALTAAARCLPMELAAISDNAARSKQADVRVQFLERVALSADAESTARQTALLAAAEFSLEHLPGGSARAEKSLKAALDDPALAGDDAWRSAAHSLLAAAIAGQAGRRDEAERLLESISGDTGSLLKLLEQLARTAARSGDRLRVDLAALQLGVIERLGKTEDEVNAAQQIRISLLKAEALAQAGRREEALAAYAGLASSQPNNGAIQEAYAELLAAGDESAKQQALGKWRQIAARSPARSERWWKAKYSVAGLQKELGDRAAAATLCRFLLETPPGIDDPVWKKRFEQLLAESSR
jgi:tetratricopeptide (TPR) repeat protein